MHVGELLKLCSFDFHFKEVNIRPPRIGGAGDGAMSDFMVQFGDCALDASVTPRPVLPGQLQNQCYDLFSRGRSAWRAANECWRCGIIWLFFSSTSTRVCGRKPDELVPASSPKNLFLHGWPCC